MSIAIRILTCFVVGLLAMPSPAAMAGNIYVSPTGSDTNSGSEDQPLASLAAAQQKARSTAGNEAITVHVAQGVYHLAETLNNGKCLRARTACLPIHNSSIRQRETIK